MEECVNNPRKISLAAGILYLITFISIPTLALYGHVHELNYIIGPGPDTPVIFGGILELIMALACIGTAIALYPVVNRLHTPAVCFPTIFRNGLRSGLHKSVLEKQIV
jgi:hypothetical protein